MMRRILLLGIAMIALCPPGLAQAQDIGIYDMAMAASRDKTDDVIRMLQARKSSNVTDDQGETPLGYAAQFGDVRMTQALLYYGAQVDTRDQFGNTPLHWAAQRGYIEVMQLLLDAKATVDQQNKQGVTPLMMAAQNSQVPALRLLLKDGADPKKQDFTGRDATGWADGKAGVLQFLRAARSG
ncbi:MAG TPA: ankyrin repeat domain-containing protein [Stellaceae bacterium]|jgi:ankyrin repeat protein